jgi:hypothetical protein
LEGQNERLPSGGTDLGLREGRRCGDAGLVHHASVGTECPETLARVCGDPLHFAHVEDPKKRT